MISPILSGCWEEQVKGKSRLILMYPFNLFGKLCMRGHGPMRKVG